MQTLRLATGTEAKDLASGFGCSPSHISRVEQGVTRPSRELVQYYEDHLDGDGMLLSLFEAAIHAPEQERRRFGGRRPRLYKALAGDASTFLGDTIPHGTLMEPGQGFEKTWRIKNSGTVPWRDRRLERQGPVHGPGLITSLRFVEIPDTEPGEAVEITTLLRSPTYDCSSIAYFKMVNVDRRICFPDTYSLGLDVLVLVRGQKPDDAADIDLGVE